MLIDLYSTEHKTVNKAIRKGIFDEQWWFLAIQLVIQVIELDRWALTRSNFDIPLPQPRDTWQSLQIFMVVTLGIKCYWHLMGRGQGYC